MMIVVSHDFHRLGQFKRDEIADTQVSEAARPGADRYGDPLSIGEQEYHLADGWVNGLDRSFEGPRTDEGRFRRGLSSASGKDSGGVIPGRCGGQGRGVLAGGGFWGGFGASDDSKAGAQETGNRTATLFREHCSDLCQNWYWIWRRL
ncbi:hypothetical protein MCA0455 [Methylococcus capsulatus str. Bath]|uniref:Uncharacterized protein n=1 Tax=Methylococcus capsulatus (strain ATCC 33009 / NCIMB 11132 / Bath) TaxID=243233 RepID=Q60BL1_METCA|nr:hypothetical protein MCA0455 [Methylococcus capsulatus str. Bath]